MDKNEKTSFIAACKDFFSFKSGQSLMEFRDEIKALTEKDKAELQAGLEQNGYRFS